MEKKGIRTEKGEFNRWIKATNAVIRDIKKKIALLFDWIAEAKAELAKPQAPDLVSLLNAYYTQRRAGAYSQKGKVSNLKEGIEAKPEIMVPLTGILYEFKEQEKVIRKAAAQLFEEMGDNIDFKVGTMIEIPRAALTADRIASSAEFFSFGTNDLTQMTFGYSRDDIASFLPVYLEKKILKVDPFQVLDQNGVGQLVRMATEKGRAIRPDLKCGICGEHGGEPSSVKFCHKVGLNYVSCSPFRVPIARIAAAQAAIED